jgi:hypothetical protein
MKIKVTKEFRYRVSPHEVRALLRGEHDVPSELAARIIKRGYGRAVVEKVAPENKVLAVAEHKAELDGATVRRRSKRAKPDA